MFLLALSAAIVSLPARAQTTFSNTSTILLPAPPGSGSIDNSVPGEPGSLYPSLINVSGLGTAITKITVQINDFRHTVPDDIDMLLVGPQGQKMIIWSDVGGFNSTCGNPFDFMACNNTTIPGTAGITVTLDDAAALDMSQLGTTFPSGTYKPTNVGSATDKFPSPAPAAPYADPRPNGTATFASAFNGSNPNGTWRLFVIDDALSGTGRIMGGWSLTVTTAASQTTTTTITGDTPDPSNIGQPATVSYNVATASGTPTGNVTVTDGVDSCTATVAAGGCSLALATAGARTLTATYAGDTNYQGSAGAAPHFVRYDTTTTLTSHAPNPSGVGQAFGVTWTVVPSPAGGPAPTGLVTVGDGVNSCSAPANVGGCSLTLNTMGARMLVASFAGDSFNKQSAAGAVGHSVLAASTTAIGSVSPEPSDNGASVVVAYSVTGSGATPTGIVTVSDGVNFCTASVAAGQCAVSFSTSGTRTISVTYPGDANYGASANSAPHVVRYNTTTAITGHAPNPSGIGQAIPITWTVTASPASGPALTGNVTVSDGVNSCSAAATAGGCSLTLLTIGVRTLSATYAGDGFNKQSAAAPVSHSVMAPSATVVGTVSPEPSDSGQSVTVTYSVTGAGAPPTGTVTVGDGVNACSASVAAGQCALTFATAGTRTITVTYPGDANYGGSSATRAHVVRYNTATTITGHAPSPSGAGQAVAISWTVTPTPAGGPAPVGNVTVTDGVNACSAAATTSGCMLTLNTAGTRMLTATYAGDPVNKQSASTAVAHVVIAPSTTTITSVNPEPSDAGQSVTVVYAVTGSGTAPTGNVTVSDGVNSCTATVAVGGCAASFATAGQRTLTVSYPGDASYAASSASVAHTVRYNTVTAITADTPDPSGAGQAVTVSFTVTPGPAGGPAPTGSVTVTDGVNSCTASAAAGACDVALATAGNRTLTATYAGDGFNKGSTSAGAAHQVKKASATAFVSHTPNPSDAGQYVTFVYTVTPVGGGTPTGDVNVTDGITACASQVGTGQCQMLIGIAGDRTVTATYSGDANFAPSSGTIMHRQRYNTSTTLISHSPSPSGVGQLVAVTFAVTPNSEGGPAPTGNVTVGDGVASCTATIAVGGCSLVLSTSGTRTLTATYAGDGFNRNSTSPGVPHVVKAGTTTLFVSSSPSPSDIGQSVTIAYSVNSTGGTPTGNVSVSDGANSCTATVAAGGCAIAFPTPGDHALAISYAGDASFAASAAQATHRVRYETMTAITGDTPNPSTAGQVVTISFGVVPTAQGGPAPTGSVTVSDGTTSCSANIAAGSCTLTFNAPGTRSITATYAGDSFNKASTSAASSHAVKTASTTAIVAHNPSPSEVGQPVAIVYTVSASGGTPTGNVTVSDGNTTCTATVATGQCTLTFSAAGERSLSVTYAGDINFAPSSAGTSHFVIYATTTTIIGHSPFPSAPGQAVTVSFMVSSTPQGGPPLAGEVTVGDGVATCSAPVSAGSCSLTLTTAGSRNLVASYAGDPFHKPSTSAGVAHQVTSASTTTITSTSPSPSALGQSVIIAFTVTGAGAAPTGSVTVTDGVLSCSASVGTSGAGQCAIAFTTSGDHPLTATYPGDATFSGSSGTKSHRVVYETAININAHSPSPSLPGQSVVVTYGVAPAIPGGPAPIGNVTISDGVNACSGTVASGSCTIALSTSGVRMLAANYAGDAFNNASLSNETPHMVASPDLMITKTHAGTFSPGQQGGTYIITVTNGGGAPSSGSVSVTDNLPTGLTATGISGAGWGCAQPAGPCSRADVLAVNATYPPLTIVVNVAANAPGSITNTATVSGGGDANPNNNTATDPTTITGGDLATLSVAKWGSATGIVTSQDGGINCGASCGQSYSKGTTVTLNATAGDGSVFTGWLGACTGKGVCTVTLDQTKVVSANFAQQALGPLSLDIDANGRVDALTDGLLVVRYLFGVTGSMLTKGVIGVNANRSDPVQVLSYLDDIEPMLDIDGNGQTDALTDGVLVVRYLFGLRGTGLTQGTVGAGATRSTAQIEAYFTTLMQ